MSKHKGALSNQQSNNNSSRYNRNNNNSNKDSAQQSTELEITKLDYAIANHLKDNLPNKEAMFVGIKRVNYFIGSKAVDLLMESKWATGVDNPTFKTRNDVVIFLNDLLLKKFYHRARKIVRTDGAKKKFKLDMHDVQVFEDSKQPYVWLYEPTSLKAWLCCFGVVIGVILVCLFPLWPSSVRTGVYYICIAGLIFLSSILTLAVLRHVVFFTLWTLTFGKLHFWILPNLTEDVGFFESFWPLYTIEKGEGGAIEDGSAEGSSTQASSGNNSSHSHQD